MPRQCIYDPLSAFMEHYAGSPTPAREGGGAPAALPALPLPRSEDGAVDVPRGVAYCPNDGLRYPAGARFCTRCEAALLVSCANCGATIRAADEACYRCGTHATLATAAE